MKSNDDPRVARFQESFKLLSDNASSLNNLSDRIGKIVSRLDAQFQTLNTGISGWVPFQEWFEENGSNWSEEVGYDKINGKWGLAIRVKSAHDGGDDFDSFEQWLFNDAPRVLRLKAIDKLPELFELLAEEVAKNKKLVEQKVTELSELANSIDPDPIGTLVRDVMTNGKTASGPSRA
jgi:hypothetical protein